jgi:signal recognition particle subunit SEC65
MKHKKIVLGLILLFIIIQFIPANRPLVILDNPNDIMVNNDVPENIEDILRTSCYDCHSNETVYPWYAYVSPVSLLVSKDTREGRSELNFSEWENLDKIEKAEILDEIEEEVEEGEMPMKIYPITHPKAKLSNSEREELMIWAQSMAESLFE